MSLDNESLQLYQLSLRKPCHTIKSIVGQFTSNKKIQEIVFANNSNIEVYRPDSNSGKLIKLCQQDTWAAVQLLETFRFPGSSVDLLVVTSDSGKLVVLKFESELNRFIPVVQEPHSKTGFRRTSPGEYLAVDPQNRAIMISAVERNHLCYRVTQADDLEQIALSSPLEVVSKSVITFDMIALDTGFDNPKFATIEQSYEDASGSDMLLLTYYEFDQALNHIMKRKGGKIPASANMLVPLPNSVGGGLLICCEGGFIYKREQEDLSELIPLPSRPGVETDYSILSFVVHKMKKNQFFILLQTTNGDIFKVTIESENIEDEEEDDSSVKIKEINVTYFDTIPVCHSLNILKSGFLFANTANDNKLYYQFEKLGEDVDENTVKWTQSGLIKGEGNFSPRDGEKLENLNLVDSLESLNPIIDSTLLSTNQIVTLSAPNYIKTISHGLPTSTLVASPLPIKPTDIFTTKLTKESKNDDYLVISSTLSSQTLVLSIGEVVEEVTDSQFIKDQPTITLQQIGETSVIQVHPNGIRYVNTATKETNDWFPPAGITILHASCNNEQVIIGLLNREICYFEVDSTDNQLIEYQDRLEMPGGVISSVSLSTSPKSSYAVVACSDSTITVISLEPHNCLGIVTLQALSSNCKSMIMLGHELHIGLDNGLYVRTQLDRTGNLSDTRTRYLGSKLIKLSTIGLLNGEDEELISGLLAISSKTWISYHYQERHKLTPLIDTRINSGASFYSEDIGGEGIVGINEEDELVIFTLGDGESTVSLDEDFTISSIKLRYTPTRLVKDVETDDSSLSLVYFIGSQIVDTSATPSVLEPGKPVPDVETDEESISIPHSSSPGWSSCLQVADISAQEIIQTVEFPKHEKAISLAIVRFEKHSENDYLVIGTTISTSPAKHYVYTFKRASTALEFVYKTEVDLPQLL